MEVLVCDFDNLCGTNPGGWHRKNNQKPPENLEELGGARLTTRPGAIILVQIVDPILRNVISWEIKQKKIEMQQNYGRTQKHNVAVLSQAEILGTISIVSKLCSPTPTPKA